MQQYRLPSAFPPRYGFARIGLSTPDGDWQFGNDGVVNDEYPQPCSDTDSKDNAYLRTVFDFIDGNPDQVDSFCNKGAFRIIR